MKTIRLILLWTPVIGLLDVWDFDHWSDRRVFFHLAMASIAVVSILLFLTYMVIHHVHGHPGSPFLQPRMAVASLTGIIPLPCPKLPVG